MKVKKSDIKKATKKKVDERQYLGKTLRTRHPIKKKLKVYQAINAYGPKWKKAVKTRSKLRRGEGI